MLDVINGTFETTAALFISLNIWKLHIDKQVRGVHWLPVGFFATWGLWNLFYYPSLGQWVSFAGGVAVVVTNSCWLGQIIYYQRKEKQ